MRHTIGNGDFKQLVYGLHEPSRVGHTADYDTVSFTLDVLNHPVTVVMERQNGGPHEDGYNVTISAYTERPPISAEANEERSRSISPIEGDAAKYMYFGLKAAFRAARGAPTKSVTVHDLRNDERYALTESGSHDNIPGDVYRVIAGPTDGSNTDSLLGDVAVEATAGGVSVWFYPMSSEIQNGNSHYVTTTPPDEFTFRRDVLAGPDMTDGGFATIGEINSTEEYFSKSILRKPLSTDTVDNYVLTAASIRNRNGSTGSDDEWDGTVPLSEFMDADNGHVSIDFESLHESLPA